MMYVLYAEAVFPGRRMMSISTHDRIFGPFPDALTLIEELSKYAQKTEGGCFFIA